MHNVATAFASTKTARSDSALCHSGCVLSTIMKITQVIFIKSYCISVTCIMLTYWRHPFLSMRGTVGYSKWITVFLGSTCRTLVQDGLAEMLPLDTDPRSLLGVFFPILILGHQEADLWSVPELPTYTTRHTTVSKRNNKGEEGVKEWKTGRTTHSQAGKRTDAQTDRA